MHNSEICNNREISKTKQKTMTGTPTSTNHASNVLLVLLETPDIRLENPIMKSKS